MSENYLFRLRLAHDHLLICNYLYDNNTVTIIIIIIMIMITRIKIIIIQSASELFQAQ